jgi:hypothetical protein
MFKIYRVKKCPSLTIDILLLRQIMMCPYLNVDILLLRQIMMCPSLTIDIITETDNDVSIPQCRYLITETNTAESIKGQIVI